MCQCRALDKLTVTLHPHTEALDQPEVFLTTIFFRQLIKFFLDIKQYCWNVSNISKFKELMAPEREIIQIENVYVFIDFFFK